MLPSAFTEPDEKAPGAAAAAEAAAITQAAILSQLAEGVIVTDTTGRITLVNPAAAAIHGVARLDVEPDAYSETYHLYTETGDPYPPLDLPLARAVRGETVREARWRIRRADGAEVLAIGNARPLRSPDGCQIGAVLTLRDDTAREAAERDLRELNATLAQRIAARTREAAAAQRAAERASAAKSEFLATMSHEIRTPLNGILGYADLLLDHDDLPALPRQHAERIQSAGAALLTIVDDVLDFSKIEAGQVELAAESFALAGLIDNAIAIVRAGADRKGIALAAEVEPGLPDHVVGDQDRLRQVLLNLLNNATKFTARGGVTLVVAQRPAAPGRAALRFSVRDTGIGIPEAKRHLLFERFSQLDATTQRAFGGTGLGLAISKRLVELMSGAIGVESREGRGSTFWFEVTLPVAEARPAQPSAGAAPAWAARRLLLVEDVPLNQELACAILRRGGHEVDVASSGAEAIRAVAARPYDLVLMDVQMPGMDGLTATRRIRALGSSAAAVPIVAMTANVLPDQVAEIRAAGLDDHIGKPFKRDALFAVIERWARTGGPAPERADLDGGDRAAGPQPGELLDRGTFADLSATLGRDRLLALCGELVEELAGGSLHPAGAADPEALARHAHSMIAACGALGFLALSDRFRELERVCKAGSDHAEALARARTMQGQVVALIGALRASGAEKA